HFTYTPVAGYAGSDLFQFKVTDSLGFSSVAPVNVSVGASGYSIPQSIHLTASAHTYFSETPPAAGNQQTWTWSGWVDASSSSTPMDLFTATAGSGSSLHLASLRLNASGQIEFYDYDGASNTNRSALTTSQALGANAWHHVVLAYDTTQAVAANRLALYVDGTQITSFSTLM